MTPEQARSYLVYRATKWMEDVARDPMRSAIMLVDAKVILAALDENATYSNARNVGKTPAG